MDAGYGNNSRLRAGITALGRDICGRHFAEHLDVASRHWRRGGQDGQAAEQPPAVATSRSLISAKELALRPAEAGLAHRQVAGGLGRVAVLALCPRAACASARYNWTRQTAARVAVDRVARGRDEPTKYWLSTLPAKIGFRRLVDITKLRWRIERDYQELKQEVGLGHYRRTRLARLPSSRHAVHRGLRIPDLRTGRQFPPQDLVHCAVPDACLTRRLSTRGSPVAA